MRGHLKKRLYATSGVSIFVKYFTITLLSLAVMSTVLFAADTDSDGVPDDVDAYPNDSTKVVDVSSISTALGSLDALENLGIWYSSSDSNYYELDDSGKVSTLYDLSGSTRHASQSDSDSRPTLVENSLNSLPTLRFGDDDSTDELEYDGSFLGGSDFTVFVVYSSASDSISFPIGGTNYNNDNAVLGLGKLSSTLPIMILSTTDFVYGDASNPISNTPELLTGVRRSDGRDLFFNGDLISTDSNSTPLVSYTNARLGQFVDNWFNGNIAEILIFNTALSQMDQIKVNGYLAEKWDLDLDTDGDGTVDSEDTDDDDDGTPDILDPAPYNPSIVDTIPPATPTNLSLEREGNDVLISWENPDDLDFSSITIRRATENVPASVNEGIEVSTNITTTAYRDNGLNDATYYYAVFALDERDNISVAATTSIEINIVATDAPSEFDATSSVDTVTLTWVNPTEADFSYVTIRRSTESTPNSITEGDAVSTNITGTSYTDSDLDDATYYYAIFATDTAENVSEKASTQVLVDTVAPSSPTEFMVSGSDDVSLSWTNPTDDDFASVIIRRSATSLPTRVSDGDAVTSNYSGTTYSDTELEDGTYYYAIFALDNSGNVSSAVTASVTVDTISPEAPSEFSVAPNEHAAILTWTNPSTDFSHTLIRRGTETYPTSLEDGVSVTENTTAETLTDSPLEDGMYYYMIIAFDAVNNFSTSVTASVEIDTTAPESVSDVTIHATDGTVSVSWTNPDSDFGYVVIRRSTEGYPESVIDGTAVSSGLTGTSYEDEGLSDDTYYYAIFVLDDHSNVSNVVTASIVTDVTPPDKATSFTASIEESSVVLTWVNPENDDFAYSLLRRSTEGYPLTSTAGISVSANMTGTSLNDTELSDAIYYYSLFTVDDNHIISGATTLNARVDTTAPEAVSELTVTQSASLSARLSWTASISSDAESVMIRRSTSESPTRITDGELLSESVTQNSYLDSGLSSSTYYYSLFVKDDYDNYSTAQSISIRLYVQEADLIDGIPLDEGNIIVTTPMDTPVENLTFGSTGEAIVTANALLRGINTVIGDQAGSDGTLYLTESTSALLDTGSVVVGNQGVGRIIQRNGIVNVSGNIQLGSENGGVGSYTMSGGQLITNTLHIDSGSESNAFTWTGGSIQAQGVSGNLTNYGGELIVYSSVPMRVTGNYTQSSNGHLSMILQSNNQSLIRGGSGRENLNNTPALLSVSGAFDMDGSIEITIDGFSAQLGDIVRVFDITSDNVGITALSNSSSAYDLTLPELGSGLQWNSDSLASEGILIVTGTSAALLDSRPLNYPNPFQMDSGTNIVYTLNRDADIQLRIYAAAGYEMYRNDYGATQNGGKVGKNEVPINRSTVGQDWPSGVYFYVLMNENKVVAKGKLALLPQ